MPYKNLLVHVDDSEPSEGRVAAAIALAEAHDAHLTGLSLAAETAIPSYIGGQLPPEILEAQRDQVRERSEAVAARFDAQVKRSGRTGESRIVSSLDIDAPSVVALHARHCDLSILGQPEPGVGAAYSRSVIETVIFSSGRPCLLVPYIGAGKNLGRNVMVAWDAGREAARAVNDALPLLERAASVTVLSVNPHASFDGHGEEPGADIALHLARHGVTVEVQQTRSDDISIGDTILSRLADTGSDLLVMGAYGHSRLREMVLGGATRSTLEQMTVPVFMSH